MLEAIRDTLIPFLPGYLELPASYVGLLKGATHKYIKRVPKAGGGYRYFYHVGHGGGVQMEEHFVPGASFQHEGGHYHIKSAEGGKLVIEHDETKERKTVSKSELRQMLEAHHEPAIKAHREKVAGMLAEARANKASPKQIAKLEARARAVGVETQGKRKAPPSKPKEGATRDEHLAAHMAASDHHEFESDQLINEAQNREEDTGKRATALREKAKEHDRAFTAHRNAMSALRHAKSDSDATTARAESEKAWAATHGLASQTGGGAKAAGVGGRRELSDRERSWVDHVRGLAAKHQKLASGSRVRRKDEALSAFYAWTADHAEGKFPHPPKEGHRAGTRITGPTSYEPAAVPDENALSGDDFREAQKVIAKLGDPAKFKTSAELSEAHTARIETKQARERQARMDALKKEREELAFREKAMNVRRREYN